MIDFSRYFMPGERIFLENVNYEVTKPQAGRLKMQCRDTIVARLISDRGVKITFNRALTFEPEGPFYLSVSFSAVVNFRPETKDEVDWHSIDIAGELRRSGGALLSSLSSRAAMLIAEITGASGSTPIITSGVSPKKAEDNEVDES